MAQVVQARCPHCKQVLRIPSAWLARPMRCKHCRQTFQAVARPPVATPAAPPVARLASPGAAAVAPPVARPVPAPPRGSPPPRAVPAGFPIAFVEAAPAGPRRAARPRPSSRPGRRGSWLTGLLIAGCVLGAAGLVWVFWGEDILALVVGPPEKPAPPVTGNQLAVRPESRETRPGPGQGPQAAVKDGTRDRGPGAAPPPQPRYKGEKTPAPTVKNPGPPEPPSKDGTRNPSPPETKETPKNPVRETPRKPPAESQKPPEPPPKPPATKPKRPRYAEEYFPRRALVVSVNQYLYANPLPYGGNGANPADLLKDFGRYLHFPKTQLAELSDAAPNGQAHAPLKGTIEQAVGDFLATSRPMDRVVLVFTGHAVELDRTPYLVPLEGKPDDAKTLLPLSWVYDRLARCPARQKVLVLDVCRLDPRAGQERKGSGPMGPALDAALKNPPAGVQAWSSCVAGQFSYEMDGGSLFLEAVCAVLEQKGVKGLPVPADPLPLEVLQGKVKEYLADALKEPKLRQTPRLAGKDPGKGAAYDPDAPLPPPLVVKGPAKVENLVADRSLVQGILDEVGGLPPDRGGAPERLQATALPTFPAQALAKYKADYASLADLDKRLEANPRKYRLIRAVRQAAKVLEEHSQMYRETIPGRGLPVPAPEKARVLKEQEGIAKTLLTLQETLEDLRKAGAEDPQAPPRWRANHAYVLAKVISRLLYLREYSLMMGKVRKDELPELKAGDRGWRLAAAAKLQSKEPDVKELVRERKKALDRLVKKFADTPWEVLARRELGTNLGLDWQADGGK